MSSLADLAALPVSAASAPHGIGMRARPSELTMM